MLSHSFNSRLMWLDRIDLASQTNGILFVINRENYIVENLKEVFTGILSGLCLK